MSTEALVGHALARTDEVERQIAAQGAVTQQAVSAATAEATRVVGRIDALSHTTEGKLAAAAQTVQVLQSQITTLQARVQELEELHRVVPAFRAQVVQLETSGQRMREEMEALRQSSLVPPSLTPVQARANRLAELEVQEEFAKTGNSSRRVRQISPRSSTETDARPGGHAAPRRDCGAQTEAVHCRSRLPAQCFGALYGASEPQNAAG